LSLPIVIEDMKEKKKNWRRMKLHIIIWQTMAIQAINERDPRDNHIKDIFNLKKAARCPDHFYNISNNFAQRLNGTPVIESAPY
jgi:hypothetical protein